MGKKSERPFSSRICYRCYPLAGIVAILKSCTSLEAGKAGAQVSNVMWVLGPGRVSSSLIAYCRGGLLKEEEGMVEAVSAEASEEVEAWIV